MGISFTKVIVKATFKHILADRWPAFTVGSLEQKLREDQPSEQGMADFARKFLPKHLFSHGPKICNEQRVSLFILLELRFVLLKKRTADQIDPVQCLSRFRLQDARW